MPCIPEQLDTGLPPRREKLLRIARIAVPQRHLCRHYGGRVVATGGAGWLWLAALASGRGAAGALL